MKVYRPCPKCEGKNTKVTTTQQTNGVEISRYIRCLDCHFRFRSREQITTESKTAKGGFSLNTHQINQIGFNTPPLSIDRWSEIYNVSTSTIIKARSRFLRRENAL